MRQVALNREISIQMRIVERNAMEFDVSKVKFGDRYRERYKNITNIFLAISPLFKDQMDV